jgi:hypothetical protein
MVRNDKLSKREISVGQEETKGKKALGVPLNIHRPIVFSQSSAAR